MNKLIAVALFMISNTASAQMAMNDPNYPAYSRAIDAVSSAWIRVSETNAWDVGNGTTDKVACMQALDELAAAHIPDSTMMEIRSDTPEFTAGKRTIAEVRKACAHIQRVSLVQAVDNWVAMAMADALSLDRNDFDARIYNNCIEVYGKAIKAGMSPSDEVVERKRTDPHTDAEFLWTGTIESLKKKYCDAGLVRAKQQQAANEAPYRAVLKADKLALALQGILADWQLAGGKQATSAKQLAAAPLWFTVGPPGASEQDRCSDDRPIVLHRYQFDARHKLVSHTMKTYCGDPPNRAYH